MGRRPVSGARKPTVNLAAEPEANPLRGLLGAYDEDEEDPPADAQKVDNFLQEIDNIGKAPAKEDDLKKDGVASNNGPWQKVWDESHSAHYYWHSGTNEVQWTEPADFGAPAKDDAKGDAKAAGQTAVPIGGDKTVVLKRKKPSRFGQGPPEVEKLEKAQPKEEDKEKHSRSSSSKGGDRPHKKTKIDSKEEDKMNKSERASRVREIMLRMGKGDATPAASSEAKPSSGVVKESPQASAAGENEDEDEDEVLSRAEVPGLLQEVTEELDALPGSTAVVVNFAVDGAEAPSPSTRTSTSTSTAQDVALVVRVRRHDWDAGALRSAHFAACLRSTLLQLQKARASTSRTVVAAAPAVRSTARPTSSIEKTLPPATGAPDAQHWLIYLAPDSNVSFWSSAQVAGHFSALSGLVAVRAIGEGFFGIEFAQSARTSVLVQLTTSSMTVPASPLEWRQLSDRVVYARQACAGDNVSLYPATHTVSCEEDGAQEGFLDAPPPPEPPIEDTKPAAADKPRPKAVKPLKGSKKLDPMIGKWKAARAEIEDFEKRNKKQTEMSPEELEEAKNRELKEWRQEQGNSTDNANLIEVGDWRARVARAKAAAAAEE